MPDVFGDPEQRGVLLRLIDELIRYDAPYYKNPTPNVGESVLPTGIISDIIAKLSDVNAAVGKPVTISGKPYYPENPTELILMLQRGSSHPASMSTSWERRSETTGLPERIWRSDTSRATSANQMGVSASFDPKTLQTYYWGYPSETTERHERIHQGQFGSGLYREDVPFEFFSENDARRFPALAAALERAKEYKGHYKARLESEIPAYLLSDYPPSEKEIQKNFKTLPMTEKEKLYLQANVANQYLKWLSEKDSLAAARIERTLPDQLRKLIISRFPPPLRKDQTKFEMKPLWYME